jgi:ribosomal protein S18 acetylase RimI-like enzyme
MEIKKIENADIEKISSLILREFPYVACTPEKLAGRLKSGSTFIFKAVLQGEIAGFVDAEILEEGIARINGISIVEKFRKQGIGGSLLDFIVDFLKKKGAGRIMLLVKQENEDAKKLYAARGFSFVGLYQRSIDNSVVEEMELDMGGEAPDYVR